jgi:hypothetical protein
VKASRAYIAGLGTSGVLIGSFLLLLAVVSAIVAFRGAPGEASNEGLGPLDLSASRQASKATGEPGSAGERDRGTAARGDRAGARGTKRRGLSAGTSGERGGGVGGERTAGGFAALGQGAGPANAGGGSAGGPVSGALGRLPIDPRRPTETPSAPSVGDVATGLGDAVEDTTDSLGGVVGRALPPLEAPIVRTGETAAGVVHQAAPVVDQTVERVTGTVGGVTERVTGVTDQVAGGLGGGGGD